MSEADVQRLLHAASQAPTQQESARLVAEADAERQKLRTFATAEREVDLANAVIADHLTPVRVHERHTAATDWMAMEDTSGGDPSQEMVAQASLWYAKTAGIRPWRDEFEEQAKGQARKLAGAYGERAAVAEDTFLTHVGSLYQRELNAGLFALADSGLPQVGDAGNPVAGGTVGPPGASGLPGSATTSERAPIMQAMENNTQSGIHDAEFPNSAQADNGTNNQRAAARHTAGGMIDSPFTRDLGRELLGPQQDQGLQNWSDRPPIVGDHGKHLYQVQTHHIGDDGQPTMHTTHEMRSGSPQAHDDVEQAAWEDHASQHGIPQDRVEVGPAMRMDADGPKGRSSRTYSASNNGRNAPMQTATCPSCSGRGRVAVRVQGASGLDQVQQVIDPNNNPKPTPLNDQVAFPWEMPDDSQQVINEAEGQIAQREQLKGASVQRRAQAAAEYAYRQVLAGQDDSGWLGDMGAGGVAPGEQDGGNPGPPSNLGQPDPVYGYGGDQGDRAIKPYGADEANDVTNNPGMGYQPGQPAQYDQAGRGMQTGASRIDDDPQLQQALAYARQRRAFLAGQGRR